MTGLPRWARGYYCPPYGPCPPEVLYPYGPQINPYGPIPARRQLTDEEELKMMEEDLSILESEKDALDEEISDLKREIEEMRKKRGE